MLEDLRRPVVGGDQDIRKRLVVPQQHVEAPAAPAPRPPRSVRWQDRCRSWCRSCCEGKISAPCEPPTTKAAACNRGAFARAVPGTRTSILKIYLTISNSRKHSIHYIEKFSIGYPESILLKT